MASDKDTLDKTIVFLQKREGIDKVLKIVRYTSRLLAAVSPPGSEAQAKFDALQSSVGTSRKAYRLGKFLQDVNGLRKVRRQQPGALGAALVGLEVVTYAGEGAYYFLDQFLWLMKAGVLSKSQEKSLQKFSAYAEAVGYAANILLNLHRIRLLKRQAAALRRHLEAAVEAGEVLDASLLKQLRLLRWQAQLRLSYIVQDLADSLLALNDITDARYKSISHPVVLSLAGLVSAAVSTYKYWNT